MPDLGSLPALNAGPNYGTLSSMLGIQQQRQALQTGAYQQQAVQADSAQAQQKNAELQAVGNLVKTATTSGRYLKPDGSFDDGKFSSDVAQVAPVYGQTVRNQSIAAASGLIQNRQAFQNLEESQQKQIGEGFGAIAAKPDASKTDVLNLVGRLRGLSDDPNYQRMIDSNLMSFPATDGMVDAQASATIQQHARQIAMAAQAQSTAQSNPNIVNIQTAGGQQPVNMNPQAVGGIGPRGAPVKNATPPGTMIGPDGSIVQIAPGGTPGSGVTPAGGIGAASSQPPPSKLQPLTRPAPNAPAADQQNYKARIEAAGQEYQGVSSAAADPMNGVQATRYRNQTILDLIPHADTGPGRALLNKAASALPGSSGDAYQDLEHYTAQNSAALASKMGVPSTNLGAQTAAAAAGNVERNPGALAEITKTNDALNTAFDLYNRGLAKVTNNGSDMSRAASYKQAFGQNLDINAIRWADAHRRGDKEEIASLAKQGPKAIASWTQRLQTLKSLADKGDLP